MTYYGKPFDMATNIQTKDFGVLQNTWTSFSSASQGPSFTAGLFGPLYARKHMQTTLESCVSPNGMNIAGVNVASSASFGDIPVNHLPCGEVKWEAPAQSGLAPFYDTYDNYIENVRQYGKDYTIIPEFRISDHIKRFIIRGR